MKALYTVRELAEMAGVSCRVMRQLLARSGVVLIRIGRTGYVPLAELEDKLRAFARSVEMVDDD